MISLEDGIKSFDNAIEINPNDAEAYFNRGNAKKAFLDHQGAILDFDKAIEINPDNEEFYNNTYEMKDIIIKPNA